MKQVEPPLKVAVVCLDLSAMDDIIIKYLRKLCEVKSFDRLYFMHVAHHLELPGQIVEHYPDLLAPLDESIEHGIQEKINEHFGSLDVSLTVDVLSGHPRKEIIHYAEIKQADLIVLGYKKTVKGSGSIAANIARHSNSSILIVPEKPPAKISKILIPIDFSDSTKRSYKVANMLVTPGATTISLIHVYHVPHGYSKTGKSYEEFDVIMLQNVEQEFAGFMENLEGGIIPDSHFINGDNEEPDELILQYADNIKADILVIGSRSKSTSAYVLLGSMAEKLLESNDHLPMLIVKRKNENMGFLEALKRL